MSAPPQGLRVDAQVRRGSFALEVAFDAPPGEVVGVLGPNGAGKSTLLRALAGLTPVSAGTVLLGERVLDDAGTGAFVEPNARPVGFVFQDYRLFPHLSVRDNVAFPLRSAGLGREGARAAADRWLGRLGLADLADRRPGALSGGQAQRVALARALAGEPALLLLDEPLSALDARTRLDVQDELRRHLSAFAGPSLLVTHDPLEALVLADRLLVLEDGRIVQDGRPGEVARRPATDYVARLVGLNLYPGRAERRRGRAGPRRPVRRPRPRRARAGARRGAPVRRPGRDHPAGGHQRAQHVAGHRRRADPAGRPRPDRGGRPAATRSST